jgi:6,7-dimethyl-8-ribityllumazine synthase
MHPSTPNAHSEYIIPSNIGSAQGGNLRIAVIYSCWHFDLLLNARQAILAHFFQAGVLSDHISQFDVAGAFEIPLVAKKLALSKRFDAIIACGLITNGGIYRHEFVAAAVIDGLMQVQIDSKVPILSAVLTPRDFHAHEDHHAFFSAHLQKKGKEVAQACLQTIALHRDLDENL